ncbi:integrase, partial [Candidatus Azambacteria bacterium]|nr:integrase [Candidatus Azambacteria bacterium]
MIKELKEKNKLPEYAKYSLSGKTGKLIVKKPSKKQKKQRRRGYLPQNPGDLIEIDTIVYFINGIRRFIITAIDLKSDFAFSYAYASLSSSQAKDFTKKLQRVA